MLGAGLPGPQRTGARASRLDQGVVRVRAGRERAGDPEKIASAGFQTRKLPSPVGNMTAATNMRARITTQLGELAVRWDKVKGRMIYVLWICEGDPLMEENWKQLLMTSKNFHTATGLVSHKAYSFRVVAVGAAGAGPASDPAIARPL